MTVEHTGRDVGQEKSFIIPDVPREPVSLVQIQDNARWDAMIISGRGHILQSSAWGELKSRHGWQAQRWAWMEDDVIRAGAQVLFKRLLPGVRVAYVPRGPVLASQESGVEMLRALRDAMRNSGAFLLKMEPDWLRGPPCSRLLEEAGFRPTTETIQPPATIRIDLTRDLDGILGGMKSKWRYNIRLAKKKGVVVRRGTREDISAFYELMRITGERDHFAIHSLDYYEDAFVRLVGGGIARLFIADYEGTALAMIFVTAFGHEAIYLYGASGNEHRNVMPNHALHWAAIQWAKSRGAERYDLWGIPEDAGNAKAQNAPLPNSLYQFKQGFGGQVVNYAGAWDFVYSPAPYSLYRLARRIRRAGIA